MTLWEAVFWIVGIVLVDHYLCGWIRRTINMALPASVLGAYPESHGWLQIVDDVFGLALVAYSEEMVFRRCARHLFKTYLGDGRALYQSSDWLTDGGPVAAREGHDLPRLLDQRIPGIAAMVDDFVERFEDAVR
jgi:hypothetical protein